MYIVLDIDQCLLHFEKNASVSSSNDAVFSQPYLDRRLRYVDMMVHDGTKRVHLDGFHRPYMRQFLKYLTENHQVGVWSAGSYNYVHKCVDVMFKNLKPPLVVMTWMDVDQDANGGYSKPLNKFFALVPEANITNTLLVDDRVDNFAKYPDNGVLIPVYNHNSRNEATDDNLLRLIAWLERNKDTTDVRSLNKQSIFNSLPVTSISIKYTPYVRQTISVKGKPIVKVE